MNEEGKLEEDIRDFWRIANGIEAYASLDARGAFNRLKEHKEDAFCEVTDYAGTGKLMCTRDAHKAIEDLAERHRDSMAIPDDYSTEELAEGIRRFVVRAMVDVKQDEPALARVLAQAVADADANHFERTYHFPCVVLIHEEPPQFQVGPVTFTAAKEFPRIFKRDIQEYVDSSSDQKDSADRVAQFRQYISDFGWLASVTVPPCAKESAQRRAEMAVTTAINLLRLVFGVDHGRDMRVVHSMHSHPLHTEYAISKNGKLGFVWSGKSRGATVAKDWHLQMVKWQGFWNPAGHLVSTTIAGKRSEIAERAIDALTWFGNAAFESAPGTQILNFVAALERLTTTESFQRHKFCSRVALLAHNADDDFEKTYWDAQTIYTLRSEVIHGTFSPTSPKFLKSLRLAHDLTRNALFRGLELHCLLDDDGPMSDLAKLQSFFDSQYSKKAVVLTKLRNELNPKKKRNK